MDKRLKQIQQYLKDTGNKNISDHLYKTTSGDEERLNLLRISIDVYEGSTGLTPEDLKGLIKKLREYQNDGTVQPISNNRATWGGKPVNNFDDVDERGLEDGITSKDGKTTDYELVDILKDIDRKAPYLDKLIGNPFAQGVKKPEDWKDKVNKLEFLKEIYPVRENISEILSGKYQKNVITKLKILQKAKELKIDGMSVKAMHNHVENWLFNELEFTPPELKHRFDFSLDDPSSFNRLVNKHTSHHN